MATVGAQGLNSSSKKHPSEHTHVANKNEATPEHHEGKLPGAIAPVPHVCRREEQHNHLVEVAEDLDHLLPLKIFGGLLEHEAGLLSSDLIGPNEENLFSFALKKSV